MSEAINGEVQTQQRGKLEKIIQRYQGLPIHELGYLHENDIREISSAAYLGSEDERASVRPLFKKTLLGTPSWYSGPTFVRDLPDLVYSPQERLVVDEEARKADEQKRDVEAEVSTGASPWLSHIRHNTQGIQNPYVVGFYQDDKGKMQTVYGERYFRSQRQIENSFFASRSETKEVNLLGTQFQRVESSSLLKSQYWDLLPHDLRMRFEDGEILVTADQDLYDISPNELDYMARFEDPKALMSRVQTKLQSVKDSYRLLYYSDYGDSEIGRTGVLMQGSEQGIKPVVITVDGQEFVVEVKGCGTKSGGFGKFQHRTGRDIITGGAEREQAENEFNRLSENTQNGEPKAVGSILFKNGDYEQGYIIRLTPSTVRASYSGNEVYPKVDDSENVKKILDMYSQELARQIFAPNPKILDRSSHSENLLLWGDGQFMFTDFSDHVGFNDQNYPHYENHGGYMTPRQMLKYYIEMVKEIPGYTSKRDQHFFYHSLSKAFFSKNKDLRLDATDTPDLVVKKIWEQGGMAYQVFQARKTGNYLAEGVLYEFNDKINGKYSSSKKNLALDSEISFSERFQINVDELKSAMSILRSRTTTAEDQEMIDRELTLAQEGDLVTEEEVMNGVYQIMTKVINYDDPGDEKIRETFSYFGSLIYTIGSIKDYLEHEKDVVIAAKVSSSTSEAIELQNADQELKEKMDEFTRILRDPHALYNLITNPNLSKRMITFNFYSQQQA